MHTHRLSYRTAWAVHPEHGTYATGRYTCSCGHSDSTAAKTRVLAEANLREYFQTHRRMAQSNVNAVILHLAGV